MPSVPVGNKVIGRTLLSDVRTETGGIIYVKGYQFTAEDLDFLDAFRINSVVVDEPAPDKAADAQKDKDKEKEKEKTNKEASQPKGTFQSSYDQAVAYMERLMQNIAGGAPIPVLEIRGWLKPLVDFVNRPTGWFMSLQPVNQITKYTYHHMVGVALISAKIAIANRFAENEIMQIALAGLLSDVGKAKIDSRIILKNTSLTTEEFNEMKQHTVLGYQIIKGTPGLSEGVAMAALQHHEREDGSGYPLGIKGSNIHPYAKIVAIADVFHAMCTSRTYKPKDSPIKVLEYIRYENVGRYDPGLVHAFIRSIAQLPLGTQVRLTDGRLGKIIYVDPNHPTRPMVDVAGQIVSLMDNRQFHIEEILLER